MNMDMDSLGPNSNKNEDRKLFVGGLSSDTTEEDLVSYFSQFGSIAHATIKFNPQTGQPRGFGFITFSNDGSIDAVLNNGPHSLKNRQIDPRRAKTKPICKKIFVGGLGSNVNEDEIRRYFGQYGNVEGVELPFDHSRNRRREFCFVIFENEESADKACYEPRQNVGGRDVDVKKAQPQNILKSNQRRNNGAIFAPNIAPYNHGGGGDYGNNWRGGNNDRGNYRQNNYQNNNFKPRNGPRPNMNYLYANHHDDIGNFDCGNEQYHGLNQDYY